MLVIFAIQAPHLKLTWKLINVAVINVKLMLLQTGLILALLATIVMVVNSNRYLVQLEPTKLQETKNKKPLLVLMYQQVTIMMNRVKIRHKFY
jgi:hypothetical protein